MQSTDIYNKIIKHLYKSNPIKRKTSIPEHKEIPLKQILIEYLPIIPNKNILDALELLSGALSENKHDVKVLTFIFENAQALTTEFSADRCDFIVEDWSKSLKENLKLLEKFSLDKLIPTSADTKKDKESKWFGISLTCANIAELAYYYLSLKNSAALNRKLIQKYTHVLIVLLSYIFKFQEELFHQLHNHPNSKSEMRSFLKVLLKCAEKSK